MKKEEMICSACIYSGPVAETNGDTVHCKREALPGDAESLPPVPAREWCGKGKWEAGGALYEWGDWDDYGEEEPDAAEDADGPSNVRGFLQEGDIEEAVRFICGIGRNNATPYHSELERWIATHADLMEALDQAVAEDADENKSYSLLKAAQLHLVGLTLLERDLRSDRRLDMRAMLPSVSEESVPPDAVH